MKIQTVNTLNDNTQQCEIIIKSPYMYVYSGTSDNGPSEIGTTSLQRTLVATPC